VINIPGYSVSGEIGRGGMAAVYRARQVLLDREVALKVLNPQLALDPVYAQRFLQEARMLAALGHPHIVPVYDVGVTPEGLHYFSMQLFTGGDFGKKLREGIDEVELIRVLLAVAQALGFAHTRGYVHRDVTPANVLFDERQRPVLTDFGIARALAVTSRITASGLSVGTSHYMSPEQARGQEVDRRSDIYSLGVLLYEALVGKPPFDGSDGFAIAYAHVHEPVPRLPEELARWQGLIDGAMAKMPDERYADCAAFIEALRHTAPIEFAQVLKKEGVAIAPLAPGAPVARPGKAAATPAAPPPAPVARPAAAVVEEEAAPLSSPGLINVIAQRPSRMPLFLAVAAIMLGVILIAGFWWTQREPARVAAVPAHSETPARTATPAGSASTRPRDAATVVPAVTAAGSAESAGTTAIAGTETDPDAVPELPVESGEVADPALALDQLPTVEDPVVKLLAMGRANIAAQRLSSPPGANALERYRTVLLFEPRNPDALAGLAAVAQAYVDLAAKQDREAALPTWLDYLARAETIATEYSAAPVLQAVGAARTRHVEELVARGSEAIRDWRRDEAIALHQRALQILPASPAAQQGLRLAEQVGQPGYAFRDGEAASQAPQMVVMGKFALARNEITVGEFGAYWRDAGRAKFGNSLPSCRDRESFFRNSRSRTWQKPGFEQGDRHPVVCVNFAMAEDYARWLGARSGKRYRLPSAAEWRSGGGAAFPAACSGNVRDSSFQKEFGGREGEACSDGNAATAPVGRFAAKKSGLYDVDGNAREWVTDCDAGGCKERLALGASWLSQAGDPAAPSFAAEAAFNTVGFRVLRELD
jgi:serine/threonine-protein kinase PpkA